jgi:MoxR-like ATPase
MATNLPVWDLVKTVLDHNTRSTLLYGPPGTGKSFAAHQAGQGRTLYSLTLTPDTPAAELRGHYIPHGDRFVWHDGPAVRAWREGAVLVLNEIDDAGGDALSFLLNCLDNPETATMTLPTGETIYPDPSFTVIATTNSSDPNNDLPSALRDRFPVCIEITEAHPDGLKRLPQDLQLAAAGTVTAEDPNRRVSLRSWLAFASLRNRIGADAAAQAVFQKRSHDVLDALKIAS